jgi:hypothetical protein
LAREFGALNQSAPNVFLLLVGQWRRAGLKYSTMDTYLGYLRPQIKATATVAELSKFTAVAKAVSLAHASEETRSAPDSTSTALLALIAQAAADLRPLLYIMLCTGARVADLQRVKREHVSITAQHCSARFGVTKNRRRRSLRNRGREPPKRNAFAPTLGTIRWTHTHKGR